MNELNSLNRTSAFHSVQTQNDGVSAPPASPALNLIVNRISGQIDRANDVCERLSVFADRLLGSRPVKAFNGGESVCDCGMIERINDMLNLLDSIIAATAETASALESV